MNLQLTHSSFGFAALVVFGIAYSLVMLEEFTQLSKSKPVVFAAGIIWLLIAMAVQHTPNAELVEIALRKNLLDFVEIFLFLFVAMTYVNTLQERGMFAALRAWLVRKQFSYRTLFWLTGSMAFCLSPIADNMTAALIMGSVILAVSHDAKFIALACINIVVAANAGGAFSPFGDITTLMVWQQGLVHFNDFFSLFLPSVVNFVVPALCLNLALPKGVPSSSFGAASIKPGGFIVAVLFILTITTAVLLHNYLHLPPALGMMTGLAYLQFFGFYLQKRKSHTRPFNIFQYMEAIEWDTLLFLYGVILCVGGLATLGYLALLSQDLYTYWLSTFGAAHAATPANTFLGLLSSLLGNIPVMFVVLSMKPAMSLGQWLLITLTAGVGGSLLSIGSAAGIALMGQARHQYTFFSHLKWSWAILLGYCASIVCHIFLNAHLF